MIAFCSFCVRPLSAGVSPKQIKEQKGSLESFEDELEQSQKTKVITVTFFILEKSKTTED
jgi:hypothetical protein